MTTLQDQLSAIEQAPNPQSELLAASYGGLSDDDVQALIDGGCQVYQGKVREVIRRGDKLLMLHTDRLSAFDRHIGMVPGKGMMLAALSRYWSEQAASLGPTHLISQPHPAVLTTWACEPVKAEVIVRGYMAGSMQRAYREGRRDFCGTTLPEGLRDHQQLPQAIITPTTKAAAYEHDEEVDPATLIANGVATASEWQAISTMALALFKLGQEIYAKHGWILVDTKYEFGRSIDGKLTLIDEAHTPDSSRLWRASSYQDCFAAGRSPEMFDKEVIRQHLIELGFQGHGEVPAVDPKRLTALARTYLGVHEQLVADELTLAPPPTVANLLAWLN